MVRREILKIPKRGKENKNLICILPSVTSTEEKVKEKPRKKGIFKNRHALDRKFTKKRTLIERKTIGKRK